MFFGVEFGFQQPRASVLPSVSRVWHIRPRCLAFSQSHGAGETKQLDPRLVAIEIWFDICASFAQQRYTVIKKCRKRRVLPRWQVETKGIRYIRWTRILWMPSRLRVPWLYLRCTSVAPRNELCFFQENCRPVLPVPYWREAIRAASIHPKVFGWRAVQVAYLRKN